MVKIIETAAAILVVVGDMHTNSFSGLVPPVVYRSNGSKEHQNEFQVWLWGKWLEFWKLIEELKKKTGLPVVFVANGDSVDKNKHAPHELIDLDPNVILNTAIEVLEPPLELADWWYIIRGTPSHAGKGSWLEERLAKELAQHPSYKNGARPQARIGTENTWVYSWWKVYLEIGGVTVDIMHRPESTSLRTWTIGGGAMRIAKTVVDKYQKTGNIPPNVAIRNHFHHWEDSGTNHATHAFILPAWQGPSSYTIGRGIDPESHEYGGMYFTCRDEKYRPFEPIIYMQKRREPERFIL